jgi:hypothetical protein
MPAVNLNFCGLALLNATSSSASIGLLGGSMVGGHDHHGDHEGGDGKHFPMLIVRPGQLAGDPNKRPERVEDLSKRVHPEWLPGGPMQWEAFSIDEHNVVIEASSKASPLAVRPPSTTLTCPPGHDWDDLGWLVNFSLKHPGLELDGEWVKSASVHMTLPNHGVVVGMPPIDRHPDGDLKFQFGGIKQAFTDAFAWLTNIEGDLTLVFKPKAGGEDKRVVLSQPNGRIDAYFFNQPAKLNGGSKPGSHVAMVYLLPMKQAPRDKEPPSLVGVCPRRSDIRGTSEDGTTVVTLRIEGRQLECGSVTVTVSRQSSGDGGEGSPLGREYCGAPLVWN